MRRTHKVARKVQTLLPGHFRCVGPIVFNPDYHYVVNGVFINGTAYKNTIVVRRLQHVFFRKDPKFSLNYSEEIYNLADPSQVCFFVGQPDELAAQIATTLTSSDLAAEMLRPYTLRDFLNQYCSDGLPAHYDSIAACFDLACAAFLVGDTQDARAAFHELKQGWDVYIAEHGKARNEFWEDRRREADEVAALLDGSDAAIRQHIIENVARNAPLLGFQPGGPP